MNWYDTFSHFYDMSTERIYYPLRKKVFEKLVTKEVSVVIDLACGTGQNFPHLVEHYGKDTQIIATDYSSGMLGKARQRANKHGWQNISFLEADARSLSQQQLDDVLNTPSKLDCVVSTLALAAVPEWEKVFATLFNLLRPGGQYLMLGVWAERRVPQTYWTEMIARADLNRKTWKPLEKVSDCYSFNYLDSSVHIHGGRLFVATGFKRA